MNAFFGGDSKKHDSGILSGSMAKNILNESLSIESCSTPTKIKFEGKPVEIIKVEDVE